MNFLDDLYSLCKAPPPKELWNRFWKNVAINSPLSCWEWQGYRRKDETPYGQIHLKEGVRPVHRVLAEWIHGDLPVNWTVDHRVCNNHPCSNPLHLLPCSRKENTLRGNGAPAINARKTHCKRGHELEQSDNRRRCFICLRACQREWARRNRAKVSN